MGHYYSEMCCPKCFKIPCKCPSNLTEKDNKWAIGKQLDIALVKDIKARQTSWSPLTGPFLSGGSPMTTYDTKEQASAAREEYVKRQIVSLEQTIESSKARIEKYKDMQDSWK